MSFFIPDPSVREIIDILVLYKASVSLDTVPVIWLQISGMTLIVM